MGHLLLERHDLAVDLVKRQIEGGLRIGAALHGVQHRSPVAVQAQVDAAYEPRQVAGSPFFRELDLSLEDLAEVALQAGQLALCPLAHLLPQTVGTVVQDDLHNPNISPSPRVV